MADAKLPSRALFVLLLLVLFLLFTQSSKIDICSYRFSNGSEVSLWGIDKGSSKSHYIVNSSTGDAEFYWSPCTPFNYKSKCKDVMMCQVGKKKGYVYPCAGEDTSFNIVEGLLRISYPLRQGSDNKNRSTTITLVCDMLAENPTLTAVDELTSLSYTSTLKSKCACPGQSECRKKSGLSIGSILLIVFFVLLLGYFSAGILFKKYHKGANSFPEIVPNNEFWGNLPGLIKDGCVFSFVKIKFWCQRLCSGDGSYSEI